MANTNMWYSIELPLAQGNAFLAFLKDSGRTCDSAGIEGGYKLISVYTTAADAIFLDGALQNMINGGLKNDSK